MRHFAANYKLWRRGAWSIFMKYRADLGQTDLIPRSSTAHAVSNLAAEESALQAGLLEKLLRRLEVLSHLTTEQFAEILHVKPETIRSGLCRTGNYCGITPLKLPNRRLAWPAKNVARLLNEEEL